MLTSSIIPNRERPLICIKFLSNSFSKYATNIDCAWLPIPEELISWSSNRLLIVNNSRISLSLNPLDDSNPKFGLSKGPIKVIVIFSSCILVKADRSRYGLNPFVSKAKYPLVMVNISP